MTRDDQAPSPGPPPLVNIGLLIAANEREDAVGARYEEARDRLCGALRGQFPQFDWQIPLVQRRRFSPLGALDPLVLLEFAVQEKIAHRWDYALAVVPNELTFRDRGATAGVPSSALEVAVLSTELLREVDAPAEALAALALHLLGHLWGLDHDGRGPMAKAEAPGGTRLSRFSKRQQMEIADRLAEVADARIEETHGRWRGPVFYWQTLAADPRGIFTDIAGYAPWKLPLRMGRLTAAAVTTIVFLLLGAESWEVGVNLPPGSIALCAIGAILAGTVVIFVGQNLDKMSGPGQWREQLIRTRIVLFSSLLAGMCALWCLLALVALLAGLAMPDAVLGRWTARVPDLFALLRHAAFMATLGVFGGALGGNLEEEGNFKSKFLFDDEA